MKQRVLITGVAGFIGSNLADAIPPEHAVIGLDNLMRNGESSRNLREIVRPIEFCQMDMRDDASLRQIVRDERIDLVYHLAALPSHRLAMSKPPRDYFEVDLMGTFNLLEAARLYGQTRVVFASSNKAYGHIPIPFKETDELKPEGSYGVAKAAAEMYLRMYADYYGVRSVAIRFHHAVGKRCHSELALPIFTERALAGEPLIVNGKREEHGAWTWCHADFTAIEDVVRGLTLFLDDQVWTKKFDVFNFGTGKMHSVLELAQMVLEATQSTSPIERGEALAHEGLYHLADVNKARRELGWQATLPLEESVKRYVEWRKNL